MIILVCPDSDLQITALPNTRQFQTSCPEFKAADKSKCREYQATASQKPAPVGFYPSTSSPSLGQIKTISQTGSMFLRRPVGLGKMQVKLDQTLCLQIFAKETCDRLLYLKVMSFLKQKYSKLWFFCSLVSQHFVT